MFLLVAEHKMVRNVEVRINMEEKVKNFEFDKEIIRTL